MRFAGMGGEEENIEGISPLRPLKPMENQPGTPAGTQAQPGPEEHPRASRGLHGQRGGLSSLHPRVEVARDEEQSPGC